MRKKIVFLCFCSLILFSCSHEESDVLHPEVKQVDVEQLVRDFFVIDDEFLLTLLEDADFLELCDVYGKRSKYIQENSIIESYNSNRILALRDSLGERYGKNNIFAYVLYQQEEQKRSRVVGDMPSYDIEEIVGVYNHEWGRCYLGYTDRVCDIQQIWRDAWTWCARQEIQANWMLGSHLDLLAYREALENFLAVRKPSFNYNILFSYYQRYCSPQIAGSYDYIMSMGASGFVSDIQLYANCYDSKICEFVIFLREQFDQFYYTGIWESLRGETLTESNSAIEVPSCIITKTGFDASSYVECILDRMSNSDALGDILSSFVGENSIAHLEWDLTDIGFDENVLGEFVPAMDNFKFTIKLNKNLLTEMPVLVVAKTIVHEAIHADLFVKMYLFRGNMEEGTMTADELLHLDEALLAQDFPTLGYFYNKYYDNAGLGGVHHEYMAEYTVGWIAAILENVFPGENDMTYKAIAWQGLKYYMVKNPETGEWERQYTEGWDNLSEGERLGIDLYYNLYMDDPNNYLIEGGCQ